MVEMMVAMTVYGFRKSAAMMWFTGVGTWLYPLEFVSEKRCMAFTC
jgi:hypothetical protein